MYFPTVAVSWLKEQVAVALVNAWPGWMATAAVDAVRADRFIEAGTQDHPRDAPDAARISARGFRLVLRQFRTANKVVVLSLEPEMVRIIREIRD